MGPSPWRWRPTGARRRTSASGASRSGSTACPFGEDGPNLIWADLAGLAALWTSTEPALDPDAAPPEQILATILGDDRLHDATLPNLGEAFDRRGPIRRYRWKDEVVWLHRVSPDGEALDHVRLARVPVDGYLDVVRRATDRHRTAEARRPR